MSISKDQFVTSFYTSIYNYFTNDIDQLTNIVPTGPYGYCGVPQVLSLFSVMETWGYLINPKRVKQSKERVKYFIVEFIPSIAKWSDVLYELIRSGITHEYFPHYDIGISKYKTSGVEIIDASLFFRDYNGTIILNVNYFTQQVKSGFDEVGKRLNSDSNLCERVYDRVLERRLNAHKANFEAYEKQGLFDNIPVQSVKTYTTIPQSPV
ncbi:hypothetical protein GCM10027347_61270 [Larkinella harenae]